MLSQAPAAMACADVHEPLLLGICEVLEVALPDAVLVVGYDDADGPTLQPAKEDEASGLARFWAQWDQLSEVEQRAAEVLGFNAQVWDNGNNLMRAIKGQDSIQTFIYVNPHRPRRPTERHSDDQRRRSTGRWWA